MSSLEQYYTEEKIGERLVALLPEFTPESCVELSAGEGALLLPVIRTWPHIDVTTCELDRKNHSKLVQLFDGKHHNIDVISPLFENLTIHSESKFDLAVSNPPFSWRPNDTYIREILDSFGFEFMKGWKRVRSEVVFILQNLKIVKESGFIAIILPELIVHSALLSEFRRCLLKICSVYAIAEVEKGAFKGTEAKTYIVVLGQKKVDKEFLYHELDGGKVAFPQKKFCHLKPSFSDDGFLSQVESVFNIKRGHQSGKELRLSDSPFYHTTGFTRNSNKPVSMSLENLKFNDRGTVVAHTGDVLLHRVGSRVIGKALVVESGSFIVSDCVFRVSILSNINPYEVVEYWESQKITIVNMARGTCAKYLTKNDIVFLLSKFLEKRREDSILRNIAMA